MPGRRSALIVTMGAMLLCALSSLGCGQNPAGREIRPGDGEAMKTQRPGDNTGLSKAGMILDRTETKKLTPAPGPTPAKSPTWSGTAPPTHGTPAR